MNLLYIHYIVGKSRAVRGRRATTTTLEKACREKSIYIFPLRSDEAFLQENSAGRRILVDILQTRPYHLSFSLSVAHFEGL